MANSIITKPLQVTTDLPDLLGEVILEQEGQKVSPFSFEQGMKVLEANMNNKTLWESVRIGKTPVPESLQYIINYS